MKKIYLKNNPIVYQGNEKVKKSKNYFEGWYFKNSSKEFTISFIPGINIENNKKFSFIQIITQETSYYIPYNFEDFSYSYDPFYIKIKNNYFSQETISLDIENENLKISGTLNLSNNINLKKHFLSPNIMGPFSYIPNMECNHAILSLHHYINGNIILNNKIYSFDNGIGYIEKDWGTSFPQSYIWCQGNCFSDSPSTCIFLSIAKIPFKLFSFTGFICVFYLNGKEYKFTTYNFSKIEKYEIANNSVNIILSNSKYKLIIIAKNNNSSKLLAPHHGSMCIHVSESITSEIHVTLLENNVTVFQCSSLACGVEIKK